MLSLIPAREDLKLAGGRGEWPEVSVMASC
jgi:hypothetical protein